MKLTTLGYIGMFIPIIALSTSVNAQESVLNICTGGEKGNYFFTGKTLEKQLSGSLKVNVIPTQGSIDNLNRIASGVCDAAVVQSDALRVFKDLNPSTSLNLERITALYKEYAHLICNRDLDIDSITDLSKTNKILVGPMGSGSYVTWRGMVLQDKSYAEIPTGPETGAAAVLKIKDGGDAQCLMFVSGLNSPAIKDIAARSDERLTLVEIDDKDFNDAKDEKGRRLYEFKNIPGKSYPEIGGRSNWTTVTVDAVVVVNTDWMSNNEAAFNYLADGLLAITPAVRARVGQ